MLFVPVAVSFRYAELFSLLAPLAAPALVAAVLPFCRPSAPSPASVPPARQGATAEAAAAAEKDQAGDRYEDASTRSKLFALQVLADALPHLSSQELLRDQHRHLLLPLVDAVLPSVGSALADIRKSVIFVLVEVHAVVGAELWPHVDPQLTAAQRKLINIYIERRAHGQQVKRASS